MSDLNKTPQQKNDADVQHPQFKLAYTLIVEQCMETEQVSLVLNIEPQMLRRWIDNEGWEQQRSARRLSPDKLIQRYYAESEKIIAAANEAERPLTKTEVDSLNKLSTSISKLDKKLDAGVVMAVFGMYNDFLIKENLQLAQANIPFLRLFINTFNKWD